MTARVTVPSCQLLQMFQLPVLLTEKSHGQLASHQQLPDAYHCPPVFSAWFKKSVSVIVIVSSSYIQIKDLYDPCPIPYESVCCGFALPYA
jgi:hypothetical protein